MSRMNSEQRAASEGKGGVTLVVAGAGTGKTTTMLEKIVQCTEKGITSPERILLMTFSRKAAVEIRERLLARKIDLSGGGFAGTFHSFSLHLLKEFSGDYQALRGSALFPSVIDGETKSDTVRSIIMKDPARFLGVPCDAVMNLAENIDSLPLYMMKKLKSSPLYNELQKVNEEYRKFKIDNDLIDYEDMVEHAARLLEINSAVRTEVHRRFNYLFVDEFQDTSENNLKLLKLLVPDTGRNLFMVGDDFQSIYRFRRAKVEYLINIKKHFPEAEIHKLTINYRSRGEIVKLSNRFIRLNRFRTDKKIKSFKGNGGRIIFHSTENAVSEAELINTILSGETERRETGILCRNNYQHQLIGKRVSPFHAGRFQLMTMHGSKGLEFDIVIIAGVSDRIIPDRGSDIEEERRLFYVAMTRAKEELHIIYHKNINGRLPKFIWELGHRES